MTQEMLFGMTDPKETKRTEERRKSKPLSGKNDPASSGMAAGRFRQSGGIETHEDVILNALFRLGNATGHELVAEIARLYPDKPLSHTQVMRRTGAMDTVEGGAVRGCCCGGKCQELRPV